MSALPVSRALSLLLAALLGGCALGPDFQRPAAPDQADYTREAPQTADAAQRFSQDASLPADWWKLFGSRALDQLVEQALAHSPTVEAAEAGLRQSQYTLRAGYGVFYPLVGVDGTAARERAAPVLDGAATPSTVFNLLTLSASVSYTLDLFGHDRRTVEGLQAQVDYQRNQRRAAYLSLSSNVVNTAIAWAAGRAVIVRRRQSAGGGAEIGQGCDARFQHVGRRHSALRLDANDFGRAGGARGGHLRRTACEARRHHRQIHQIDQHRLERLGFAHRVLQRPGQPQRQGCNMQQH